MSAKRGGSGRKTKADYQRELADAGITPPVNATLDELRGLLNKANKPVAKRGRKASRDDTNEDAQDRDDEGSRVSSAKKRNKAAPLEDGSDGGSDSPRPVINLDDPKHVSGGNVRRTVNMSPDVAEPQPASEYKQASRGRAQTAAAVPTSTRRTARSPKAPAQRATTTPARASAAEAPPPPKTRTPAASRTPAATTTPYSAASRKPVDPYNQRVVEDTQPLREQGRPVVKLTFAPQEAPPPPSPRASPSPRVSPSPRESPFSPAVDGGAASARSLWVRSPWVVLAVALAVVAALVMVLPGVLSRERFCDTNSTSISGTESACSPCPLRASCAHGVVQCDTGFLMTRAINWANVSWTVQCVLDDRIKRDGAKLAASVAHELKSAAGQNNCTLSRKTEATLSVTALQQRIRNANMTARDVHVWEAALALLALDACINAKRTAGLEATTLTAVCDEVRPWSCYLVDLLLVQWRIVVALVVAAVLVWRVLSWRASRARMRERRAWLKSESLIVKDLVFESLKRRLVAYENGEPGAYPHVRIDAMRDEILSELGLWDSPDAQDLWKAVVARIREDTRVQSDQHVLNGEHVDTWELMRI